MSGIWTMGEMLVEIMRPKVGIPLDEAGPLLGPYPSGAPAIFIDTVARLGHPAGIIGAVGDDDFGRCLTDRLRMDGVDCRSVQVDPDGSTAVAFVTYFADGSRRFLYHINETPAARADLTDPDRIKEPAYFHVMGCSLMTKPDFAARIVRVMQNMAAQGARVSFDPNIRPELLRGRDIREIVDPVLALCSVLLPGTEELLLISGEPDVESAVQKLFENPILDVIALKQGSRGSTIYTRENRFQIGVFPVEPIDPTGAGDCFDAGFVCGLLEGLPLETCARMASAAASLNTAAFGPMSGDISRERLEQVMHTQMTHEMKGKMTHE